MLFPDTSQDIVLVLFFFACFCQGELEALLAVGLDDLLHFPLFDFGLGPAKIAPSWHNRYFGFGMEALGSKPWQFLSSVVAVFLPHLRGVCLSSMLHRVACVALQHP